MPAASLRSLQHVRQLFEGQGVTVSEWADEHGFARQTVYAVLGGRSKGRRGEAHAVSVALGLKPDATAEPLVARLGAANARTKGEPQ